ncbi:hypothetical protein ACFL35_03110 [Candidatus Riflebacteria bacterium]
MNTEIKNTESLEFKEHDEESTRLTFLLLNLFFFCICFISFLYTICLKQLVTMRNHYFQHHDLHGYFQYIEKILSYSPLLLLLSLMLVVYIFKSVKLKFIRYYYGLRNLKKINISLNIFSIILLFCVYKLCNSFITLNNYFKTQFPHHSSGGFFLDPGNTLFYLILSGFLFVQYSMVRIYRLNEHLREEERRQEAIKEAIERKRKEKEELEKKRLIEIEEEEKKGKNKKEGKEGKI